MVYNYDKCIITENSDPESSLSDSFTINEPQKMSDAFSANGEFTSTSDAPTSNEVELNLKDYFVLMLGLLNEIERYFNDESDDVNRKESLKSQMTVIKNLLLQNCEGFGIDQVKNINGDLYISDDGTTEGPSTESQSELNNKVSEKKLTKPKPSSNNINSKLPKKQKNGQLTCKRNMTRRKTISGVVKKNSEQLKENGDSNIEENGQLLPKSRKIVRKTFSGVSNRNSSLLNKTVETNGQLRVKNGISPKKAVFRSSRRCSGRLREIGEDRILSYKENQLRGGVKARFLMESGLGYHLQGKERTVSRKRRAKSLDAGPSKKLSTTSNNSTLFNSTNGRSLKMGTRKLYYEGSWLDSLSNLTQVTS